MRATKDKANFKGTMAEFFKFMRTDPQFYAKTPRELLSFSAYVASLFKATGRPYRSVTGSPAMIHHRAKSPIPDSRFERRAATQECHWPPDTR